MNEIPSVYLTDFLSAESVRKQKFNTDLGNSFEEIGFAAYKGQCGTRSAGKLCS